MPQRQALFLACILCVTACVPDVFVRAAGDGSEICALAERAVTRLVTRGSPHCSGRGATPGISGPEAIGIPRGMLSATRRYGDILLCDLTELWICFSLWTRDIEASDSSNSE